MLEIKNVGDRPPWSDQSCRRISRLMFIKAAHVFDRFTDVFVYVLVGGLVGALSVFPIGIAVGQAFCGRG